MRSPSILVLLGSLVALATAAPAFGWSQGWDWDEDVAPRTPLLIKNSAAAPVGPRLQVEDLDALSDPFCVEATEPSAECQIHA